MDDDPRPAALANFHWDTACSSTVIVAVLFAITSYAGLGAWGWVIGLVAALAAGVLVQSVFDMWPKPVPPPLQPGVDRMLANGFTRPRRHPWTCTEKRPHVHMRSDEWQEVRVVYERVTSSPNPDASQKASDL